MSKETARNSSNEPIEVGMRVDRLDNYKCDGEIMAIDKGRAGCLYVLVRWPTLDDEWMHPAMLYERKEGSE